jgi:hypothetical protein
MWVDGKDKPHGMRRRKKVEGVKNIFQYQSFNNWDQLKITHADATQISRRMRWCHGY